VYFGEREAVRDLEYAVLLHSDYAARRKRGEGFAARGSDLDCDLGRTVSLSRLLACEVWKAQWRGAQWGYCFCPLPTYQGVDLHRLEQRIFLCVRHDVVVVVERSRVGRAAGVVALAFVVVKFSPRCTSTRGSLRKVALAPDLVKSAYFWQLQHYEALQDFIVRLSLHCESVPS
jgi:hypothetical protein